MRDTAVIQLSGVDRAGNPGMYTDNASLTIAAEEPGLPLCVWMPALVLLITGALLLRGKRTMSSDLEQANAPAKKSGCAMPL